MPATSLVLYPGSAWDITWGGAGAGWSDAPLPAEINDGSDNPVDPTYGLCRPGFSDARDFYAEFKLALPPLGVVSIASLRLIAWVMATGTGGTYDTDISGMVRPAGSGVGAGGDYYSTPITHTSESAAAELFVSREFAAWTVNPLNSLPWTLSDLAAMAFGVRFQCPAVDPVNNASIKLGRLRMVIEATSTPADTAAVRTVGSTALRVFSRELLLGKITGPAVAADVGIGEIFFLEHNRGRRPGGPGWSRKPWQRRPLFAISKSIDWLTGQATITWEDPRRRMTRLWVPGLTTLGFSLDGKGLPLLHSGGGGPVCTRAGIKLVDRPGNPTDNVMQIATHDILADDYRGMCIEAGDDTNLIVNSTFSQGAGDTLDAWTPNVSGSGTVTQETARVGVDESGFRRSAHLQVGVTDASVSQITQVVTVAEDFRMGIRSFNNFGVGLGMVMQRASDSKWWNDAGPSWDVAMAINRIADDVDGGYREWVSENITSGADTVTISIGYFGESPTSLYQAFIWSVDLVEGRDHVGTPILTTTTPVARIADVVRIPNNEVVRWYGFERGFSITLGAIPLWNSADLDDGVLRILLHVDHGDGGYSQIAFQKGVESVQDRFLYSVYSATVSYLAEYVVQGNADLEPVRGRLVKISCRYIGAEGELDKTPHQIEIAVNDDWDGGTPDVLPSAPTMDAVSTGYLGHAFTGVHEIEGSPESWWGGFLRQADVPPFALEDEELERKPS